MGTQFLIIYVTKFERFGGKRKYWGKSEQRSPILGEIALNSEVLFAL